MKKKDGPAPKNIQIETVIARGAEIGAKARSLASDVDRLDAMMEQMSAIHRCGCEFRLPSNDWEVWFELSPDGEEPLTASDFEIEIRRMLKGHL